VAEGGTVQCGEDIAQMIEARRAVGEGLKAPQQIGLLVPEPGDIRAPPAPASVARRARKRISSSRQATFPACRRSGISLK
jgi:hypothetical protein